MSETTHQLPNVKVMSETIRQLPKARIQKDALSWFFWTLPIAAALMCGWFLLHDFVFAGPTITIYFQDAQGLQEQNSMLRYRGIKVGSIKSLELAGDRQTVAIKVKLDYSAKELARQGAQFWIVRPQLRLGEVSGLQTIVSGSYIAVQPGSGARTNTFSGLTQAPITAIPGITITLLANNLDALQSQSGIFYRGFQVGEVTGLQLDENARFIVVQARIRQDVAPLVRKDSQFWNAGGINAHVGLFSGLQISAESAATLVSGGISFATPENYGPAATNGSVFFLNDKPDPKWEAWAPYIPLGQTQQGGKPKSNIPQLGPQITQ